MFCQRRSNSDKVFFLSLFLFLLLFFVVDEGRTEGPYNTKSEPCDFPGDPDQYC